jgi:quercetin dioxygenase-like cupin family protein
MSHRFWLAVAVAIALFVLAPIQAADLNPAAIMIKPPDQIKWTTSESGSSNAVLLGDPAKPGLYIVLTKWSPGHMSRPHSHPNDRYITVLSGTWWVGTGTTYDPALTKPVKAGSFVIHYGKEIHWDGAKEETGECVLEILGMGPATSTPANKK